MNTTTIRSIFTAMFAALICISCFIAVPVGPGGIPIVMQNMLVILAGCLLGSVQGAAAAGLFLMAGGLGLPVFSGGRGGFAVLTGPTGGFLWGYFFGALAAGLIAGRPSAGSKDNRCFSAENILRLTAAAAAGFCIIYVPGVIWFMHLKSATLFATLAACVLPFIPGDCIKLVITVIIALRLRPVAGRYLNEQA